MWNRLLQWLLAVLIATAPLATHAQRVQTGDRIRVSLIGDSSRSFIGAVEQVSRDSVVLRHSGGLRLILAVPSIATVAVSQGPSKSPELLGGVLGFALGFASSYAAFNREGVDQSGPVGLGTGIVNLCMGLVGGGIGIIVGRALAPEQWSPLRVR